MVRLGKKAFRYEVHPDISRENLAALIEDSTVELEGKEHRASHSAAGDFVRWSGASVEMLLSYGAETLVKEGRSRRPSLG